MALVQFDVSGMKSMEQGQSGSIKVPVVLFSLKWPHRKCDSARASLSLKEISVRILTLSCSSLTLVFLWQSCRVVENSFSGEPLKESICSSESRQMGIFAGSIISLICHKEFGAKSQESLSVLSLVRDNRLQAIRS